MAANDTKEQSARIVEEMREMVHVKLENMEAEGVASIPIGDVHLQCRRSAEYRIPACEAVS